MEATMLPGSRQPTDQSHPDPAQLVDRFRSRDPSAARELYRRFGSRIFAMGTAMLGTKEQAEELVQDAFLNLWRNAAGFDSARDSLDDWVLRVALGSILRRRHEAAATMAGTPRFAAAPATRNRCGSSAG